MTAVEHSGWTAARGMAFTTENVPLLIDGTKTQTRRLVKPQPQPRTWPSGRVDAAVMQHDGQWYVCDHEDTSSHDTPYKLLKIPHPVGSFVYVRETWATEAKYDHLPPSKLPKSARIWYLANGPKPDWCGRTRSPRFMPKWASRILLQVTDVRVQRLQGISEEDAKAEGAHKWMLDSVKHMDAAARFERRVFQSGSPVVTARAEFAALWNSIHKPPHDWAASPWVFAYTVKLVEVRHG